MKLYQVKGSHSDRCAWLLHELGVPYDAVDVDLAKQEHRTADYLRLHPLGQVPLLVDGDQAIFDSSAILAYLADRYPDRGLAPAADAPERGVYLSWLFSVASSIAPAVDYLYVQQVYVSAERRNQPAIEAMRAQLAQRLQAVEAYLREREFLVGEKLSAADIALVSTLLPARKIGVPLPDGIPAYMAAIARRPAYRKVFGP